MLYQPLITKSQPYIAELWSAAPFQKHWHDDVEIIYLLEGQIEIDVDSTAYRLSPGDVVLIMPGCPHEILVCGTHATGILVEFGYSLLGSAYRTFQDSTLAQPCFRRDDIPKALERALSEITQTLRDQRILDEVRHWTIQSMILQIAIFLAGIRETQSAPQRGQLCAFYPLLNFVQKHYSEQISVKQAALISGYNENYFCRKFKKTIGTAFHRYLNYYRICMSRYYLDESAIAIKEIAIIVGFSSSKEYCYAFKRVLGISPSEYQRMSAAERHRLTPKYVLND